MYRNEPPPLSDWILDAYRQFAAHIQSRDGGLPTEDAKTLLIAEEIGETDVEYALERLLDRGYLYQVKGKLFVTQPDEIEEES